MKGRDADEQAEIDTGTVDRSDTADGNKLCYEVVVTYAYVPYGTVT